jgi:hypothetical protein
VGRKRDRLFQAPAPVLLDGDDASVRFRTNLASQIRSSSFPQPHTGAAAVLGDELDAGPFERCLKVKQSAVIRRPLPSFKICQDRRPPSFADAMRGQCRSTRWLRTSWSFSKHRQSVTDGRQTLPLLARCLQGGGLFVAEEPYAAAAVEPPPKREITMADDPNEDAKPTETQREAQEALEKQVAQLKREIN